MTTKATKAAILFSDLAIPPGEVLEEELEERGMTQEELAAKMGCSPHLIDEVIRAESAITPEIAAGLGKALGIDGQFWLNFEEHYQLTLEHIRAKAMAEQQAG